MLVMKATLLTNNRNPHHGLLIVDMKRFRWRLIRDRSCSMRVFAAPKPPPNTGSLLSKAQAPDPATPASDFNEPAQFLREIR
jgi:hypothetical protein